MDVFLTVLRAIKSKQISSSFKLLDAYILHLIVLLYRRKKQIMWLYVVYFVRCTCTYIIIIILVNYFQHRCVKYYVGRDFSMF